MGVSGKAVFWASLSAAAAVVSLPPSLDAARSGAPRAGGTIVGVITTQETGRPPLKVTIDPGVCGTSVVNETVVVDATGHLANAVVTVTGVQAPAPPAVAMVSNEKCRFVPHVSVLKPAGAVKVTNKDPQPVLHTTHAQMVGAGGKFLFNVSLPIPNMTISKPVEKAGVIQLVCNTHPWMRGWLVVTAELSATSGADGKFQLDNVPAGTQELRVWHENLKAAPMKVTVKDGETVTVNLTLSK